MISLKRKVACSLLAFVIVFFLLAIFAYQKPFGYAAAALIGAAQGITEFLPISSTAHLLLLESLLDIDFCRHSASFQPTEALCSFDVVIQIGTILATIIFFQSEIRTIWRQSKKEKCPQKNSIFVLCCSFIPTGIIGFLFRHKIAQLYQLHIIASALILGALMIFISENLHKKHLQRTEIPVVHGLIPSIWRAIVIGCWQCLALIPGVSRSMSTIVGGYLCGLGREIAVKFSFLLGLLTCLVASIYKLISSWDKIFGILPIGITLVGIASSALTSLIVIRFCIKYMVQRGLNIFGYYRIFLAIIIFAIA